MPEPTLVCVEDFRHSELSVDSWQIERGSSWAVVGRNGSGKQWIDQLLRGRLAPVGDVRVRHACDIDKVRLISFEVQQEIYERELRLAANDLLEEKELGTPARDFLPVECHEDPLVGQLGLAHRLDIPYRLLSTGESRKLLILQALLEGTELLVLDNPFDSLDRESLRVISDLLAQLAGKGIAVVLLLSNRADLPGWVSELAAVESGVFTPLGSAQSAEAKACVDRLLGSAAGEQPDWPEDSVTLAHYGDQPLVSLKACSVSYGGRQIIDAVDLVMAPLQHTLVTGANGSGKSTLIGLITGDCPQCYSNDVEVFGYRRGSGESIWDIQRHMGIVSNELHRRYRISTDVLSVVCSGFHDSIGLYDPVSEFQRKLARQWLGFAGLEHRAEERFQALSYGEQRLVLIARALVKSPLLLILDEPSHGLDEPNRHRLLAFLERLDERQHSTILLVSHREDEYLPLFSQHLELPRPQTT